MFNRLFKDAKYTILGDINQTVEKAADHSLYDDISKILNRQKTMKLFLNKGYRSSYEINKFTQNLLGITQEYIPFERHGHKPRIEYQTPELINRAMLRDITDYTDQGYESIAVICKTWQEAENVHAKLKNMVKIHLINPDEQVEKGALVIPSYMAKGLEFDVVIVYDADKVNYANNFDRKLLYIACTRALHQLIIYYTGEKSPFI